MVEISAANTELIMAIVTEQFNEFQASATPEQKAAETENMVKFTTDEEFKNQQMALMNTAWTNADANSDGKLDLAEYIAFQEAMKKITLDKGEWYPADNGAERVYNIINSFSEGDGITMPELFALFGPWMAKWQELKTAAQ